ncbi:MAG: transposase [Bacteroidales bacterium]|nr:transposase [Bacteroidales bacterium]
MNNRNLSVIQTLYKQLFGKLYKDKGYIPTSLFELLFEGGLHPFTGSATR